MIQEDLIIIYKLKRIIEPRATTPAVVQRNELKCQCTQIRLPLLQYIQTTS